MPKLRIEKISIINVSNFRSLDIDFNENYNLICGNNGVGKTSLLNIIAASFGGAAQNPSIKKNAIAQREGQGAGWSLFVDVNGQKRNTNATVTAFSPEEKGHHQGLVQLSDHVLYLKTNRDFSYKKLTSISRDPSITSIDAQSMSIKGVDANQIKTWFTNRYLLRPHGQDWPKERIENLESAISALSTLDSSVSLARVDTSTFDIYVDTKYGTVPYEYLSSGFRAAWSILLGIIKEIELRGLGYSAQNFSGVIIIDELDLHLHPTWQRIMPSAVRELFPNAQIIASSHSPHMAQDASQDELIALQVDEGGIVNRRHLPSSKYGFKGWTIEEILKEVMGLGDTRPDIYSDAIKSFGKSIDNSDATETKYWLGELEEMLHPSNHLRKILRIQAASIIGELDD